MILNEKQIRLLTQLLGNRIAELRRMIGLDDAFEIKRKNHKYLEKELELSENMLYEILEFEKAQQMKMKRNQMIDLVKYVFKEVDFNEPQVPYEIVDLFLIADDRKQKSEGKNI